jgi:hypothetical protein
MIESHRTDRRKGFTRAMFDYLQHCLFHRGAAAAAIGGQGHGIDLTGGHGDGWGEKRVDKQGAPNSPACFNPKKLATPILIFSSKSSET